MSDEILKVDPTVLRAAGDAFRYADTQLARLQPGEPLAGVVRAVPESLTAGACDRAESEIAAHTTALAGAAGEFGANLVLAADWYQRRDQASAEAIGKISR